MTETIITDLQRVRRLLREDKRLAITDAQLIALATGIEDPPARPSDCCDWAEREAVPLINELGHRMAALVRWNTLPGAQPITGDGLRLMGFTRDDSAGHPIYKLKSIDEIPEAHTSLHLLPSMDGWIAEIHNWQTDSQGERLFDINQIAGLPRLLRTYADVRRLCSVVSDRWEV